MFPLEMIAMVKAQKGASGTLFCYALVPKEGGGGVTPTQTIPIRVCAT